LNPFWLRGGSVGWFSSSLIHDWHLCFCCAPVFSNAPDPKHHSKQELAAMTPADIRQTLLGLHNTWSSPIPELITRATAADATPVARIVICDVQDLPSWTRGRVVLIGDAGR
jgi:hypothetical protein